MEIEQIKITDLKPAEYNPRKISSGELSKLTNSIEEFGLVDPIIINLKNMNIIGGHQRYDAIYNSAALNGEFNQDLNLIRMGDVGWVFLDTELNIKSDDHEKALNLALNKISGEWDYIKLEPLLEGLTLSNVDLELTGFDGLELDELDVDFTGDENYSDETMDNYIETEDDEFEPDDEIDVTVHEGDIYQLGNHRLMCGDSCVEEDVNKLLDGVKIDSLITDPPYGVDYSQKNEYLNEWGKGNRVERAIKNDALENYREFFGGFLSNIIPNFNEYNTFYIFMSGKELHNLRLAIEDVEGYCADYLIWLKNNHVLSRKDYSAKHEFACYGWYGKHKYYGGFSTTILEYDKPHKSELHPTMKPIPLIARLICDGSPENGVIFDAFGGSGTTLMACEQTNRKCYTIELDPYYCQVIINRWEEYTGGKAEKVGV